MVYGGGSRNESVRYGRLIISRVSARISFYYGAPTIGASVIGEDGQIYV